MSGVLNFRLDPPARRRARRPAVPGRGSAWAFGCATTLREGGLPADLTWWRSKIRRLNAVQPNSRLERTGATPGAQPGRPPDNIMPTGVVGSAHGKVGARVVWTPSP